MEVRDGVDESGQLVGKYCGKIAPSPVVSSGNQLFIKFVSDYETHGAGFSIRYEIFKTGGWPNTDAASLYLLKYYLTCHLHQKYRDRGMTMHIISHFNLCSFMVYL